MKYLISLLVLFISCSEKTGELQYINLYTTTIISINCDEVVKSNGVKKLIFSKEEEAELIKIFSKLKPADSDWNIDARVFGFIFENSTKLRFCMSTTIIEINGKKYFVNDELRDYILKIT